MINIAIDGPAGAGKSTIAKNINGQSCRFFGISHGWNRMPDRPEADFTRIRRQQRIP